MIDSPTMPHGARLRILRLLTILLFVLIQCVADVVLTAVVLFQLAFYLVTGRTQPRVLAFADGLTTFLYQVLRYLTFNRDAAPFPFDAWPSPAHAADLTSEASA